MLAVVRSGRPRPLVLVRSGDARPSDPRRRARGGHRHCRGGRPGHRGARPGGAADRAHAGADRAAHALPVPDAGCRGRISGRVPEHVAGQRVVPVGQPAPRLEVVRVGGGTIDLAAMRGKPLWVNFTGTYCPPCRDQLALMTGFQARYASAGLVVVAVDVNEDEATIASFARQLNVTFPIGLDPDGSVSQGWGANVLPVHYWIDATGIVRDGASCGIGSDRMAQGLTRILPGVTVSP